jgi:hypothetical protein
MSANENPAPRANAGSRANSKVKLTRSRASALHCEAKGANCPLTGAGESSARLRIDFAEINRAALPVLPAIAARLLPGGKGIGHEFVALNPRRRDRHLGSFKINIRNGRWADFATGDRGGDPIGLVAYVANVSQSEAARLLAQMLGFDFGRGRQCE